MRGIFGAVGNLVLTVVGFASGVIALGLFGNDVFGWMDDQGLYALFLLSILLLLLLINAAYVQLTWGRDRKYAKTLKVLNAGFASVHNELDKNHDGVIDLEDARIACEAMCNNLSRAFQVITGTMCSATVKILLWDEDEGDMYAHALARDEVGKRVRAMNDKLDRVKHYVKKNTCFTELIKCIETTKEDYFLRNNLPRENAKKTYRNTSFDTYGEIDKGIFVRLRRWPLPYKSTLVVPIAPNSPQERTENNLLGFLCIDSESRYAFSKDYDVDLATGVADSLYNFLNAIHKEVESGRANLT